MRWASRVKVPVLSKIKVSTSAKASKACKWRTKTPCRASVPDAANIAAGVASDKAQGHVTINTDTATINAMLRQSEERTKADILQSRMRGGAFA